MKPWMLILVALLAIQQPEPERRDDKYKDDPHAFCYPGPERGSAHNCTCAMVCGPDATGTLVQQETTSCAMYCSKQRCSCHAEDPCIGPDPA